MKGFISTRIALEVGTDKMTGMKVLRQVNPEKEHKRMTGAGFAIDEENDVSILFSTTQDNNYSDFDVVIVADAVVNSGKTIIQITNELKNKQVIVATNVISDKYLDNLKEFDIFTTRISNHSFKGESVKVVSGGKGPDTGERLFNNSFFK